MVTHPSSEWRFTMSDENEETAQPDVEGAGQNEQDDKPDVEGHMFEPVEQLEDKD